MLTGGVLEGERGYRSSYGGGDARRERLLAASEGLPTILWDVLIGGSVITIAFTYLFGLDSTMVHTLMVAALAVVLSLSLFTIAALDYPFRGDVSIHPDAFEQVLERFHESKLSDLWGLKRCVGKCEPEVSQGIRYQVFYAEA